MQAIILAAGMGKRLKELTKNNTKCMVEVNGVTLIDRMLHQIDKYNLNRIIMVVGYEGKKLIDYVSTLNIKTKIEYIDNPIYYKTNNIYSLSLAKDYLIKDNTLLFESDLIFEDSVLDELINDTRETLTLVDKYEGWMDGTCVKLNSDDSIEKFVPGKNFKFSEIDSYYKTVNIYKFSKKFSEIYYVPFLEAYLKALGENEYYEQVLKVITTLDYPEIKAKRLSGQLWYEIDDIQDLDIATSMFTMDEDKKMELIQNRDGGYWRYPKLLDFCHLVNPYFPSQKLIDEMKASFEKLLIQYPSGMEVDSLLVAKIFDIHKKNIVAGNGTSELIKFLMNSLDGKIGFVGSIFEPTVEEHLNRCNEEKSYIYTPKNEEYFYTADNLIEYFKDKKIKNLFIINPDNLSGNYIPKNDLLKIINWSKKEQISFIIDESLVDFSDEENSTIIEQKIVDENPQLYIIRSISKSFGVPGIRLGILVSGNIGMIEKIKKDVSKWNINSFGEFYLQIYEKYKKDYKKSLQLVREERKRFQDELMKIDGIKIIPSQANFIMIELLNGINSRKLATKLLVKHDILVKDLSSKIEGKQFLRLTIKNVSENNKIIEAIKKELGT